MKRKTFVTLFEKTNNEILMKDVGLIPYFMFKDYGYDACVATCKMSGNYSYLDSYLNGFKMDFFEPFFNSYWLGAVLYLFKNSKKIDILNIYHLKLQTYVLYWVYYHLNKKGKTYLKLDIGPKAFDKKDKLLQRHFYKKFLKDVDYCTVESTEMQKRVFANYGVKINVLPNGYYDFAVDVKENKENVFLTVGRLGTPPKNTETLLEAFKKTANKHNWKLVLAGSIEDDFKDYIEDYFKSNPKLKDRVQFVGKIVDKRELKKYYEKAKVFVLPSRYESFGLVLLEAMYSGCFIVGTDRIPPMKDLINDGKYGTIIKADDVEELSNVLLKLTKEDYSPQYVEEIKKYAVTNFSWYASCKNILKGLGEL